ncbi:MAG: bifunctional phosphoribosylaminoimidazolecarboxamide formyltransferase/IMP cyclohydrolase [Cytophagales bacterium]|nr:bifunctional phosphoribosylaminoimidazolecarboxamide formyltransferase/IMP cyclohydrolase [Cytophagales bacterium]MDW8384277.1 bifunctional phosphoribosylaminoimidazolecarboxamide formyltransferase/IMP cyclohydrolase [Flammeovirgaceae bacterium]
MKKITSALISVFYKDNLENLVKLLAQHNVKIYSTGGTQEFITSLGIPVVAVEHLTNFPSIFGGRVKTLHPKVFGGILYRRENKEDIATAQQFEIPPIDMVIVDLYPFEETVAKGASPEEIIEKIDIGGISLIRAAAKNFQDVLVISSKEQYQMVEMLLSQQNCATSLQDRRYFAAQAFDITSHYDTAIFHYLNQTNEKKIFSYKESIRKGKQLRYGENPHQSGFFYGELEAMFDQLNGKELSYNNLIDIDAAIALIDEFPVHQSIAFAILKHNNACGCATASTAHEAYLKALAADPVSAFGGVLVCNATIDKPTAEEINKLFIEILIAPDFTEDALAVLKSKSNRILLKRKSVNLPTMLYRTTLNGVIGMEKDLKTETEQELKVVTQIAPTAQQIRDMLFAMKIAKHSKSNAIVFAVDGQMYASGVGQTSRIDALKQAIEKAQRFGFDLRKAAMASEAFFPFSDCVAEAHKVGVKAVIQPGGSKNDVESIQFCNQHGMTMVFTGIRHFKH